MALPLGAYFLGKSAGKKTTNKTIVKKEAPKAPASTTTPATNPADTQEEKRRKALQASNMFGTTSDTQEGGLY